MAEDQPQTVGPYRIIKTIGSGAFATVYSAEHSVTLTTVALKAVAKAKLRSTEEFQLLQREVGLMKTIDHPFIGSFFEVTDDADNFYIAMELVENGSLLDYINVNKGLQEQQARRVFCQLVSVLGYLHYEKRIVHRDLKAENVLLDKNYNVRLVDFGLSKAFQKDDPFLQTTCGSPAYVAPEIIRENPYTAAADIWSLGILLYAMVCASLPFNGDNISAMLQAILQLNPMFPKTISPELKHLMQRLLVKDAAGRITIAEIKEHPWIKDFGDSQLLSDEFGLLATMRVVNPQEADTSVISEMKILGYETGGLLNELKSGAVNPRTAAYKMLKRKITIDEIDRWQKVKASQEKPKNEKLPQLEGASAQKKPTAGGGESKVRVAGARKPGAPVRRTAVPRLVGQPSLAKV